MEKAARGAIKIDANTEFAIKGSSVRLVTKILEKNHIRQDDIIYIIFSLTHDIDAFNPATGLRSIGFKETPLFCVQEAKIKNQTLGIIRVLIVFHYDGKREIRPVYLDGAENLRSDLFLPQG